jgi:uncharacterized membrane protein
MSLLFPLLIGLLGTRSATAIATRKGARWVRPWSSWPAAAGIAIAAVLLAASGRHFREPQRSGLVAIVPERLPAGAVVTATGLLERALAASLVFPRSRRAGAAGAGLLLVAMFPANVVAARGVEEPSAPNTPLVRRTLLQLLLLAVCGLAARRAAGSGGFLTTVDPAVRP